MSTMGQPFADRSVALLHYSCPPVVGGVEFVLEAQARWFHELGADVEVIVGTGESFHDEIPVRTVEALRSDQKVHDQAVQKAMEGEEKELEKLIDEAESNLDERLSDFNTIIPHNLMTMPFNLVGSRALSRIFSTHEGQFFLWTHDIAWLDDAYETPDRWPHDILGEPADATAYVAISGLRRDQLRNLFNSEIPVEIVHDAIQFDDFHDLDPRISQLVRERELHRDDIVALYPARIVRRKNIEKAIYIARELKEYGNRIHLIVTGPPDPHNEASVEYYEELLELRDRLDLNEEVIFCYDLEARDGSPLTISYDQIRQFYRISDILLMTTKQEGFGLPLLEAGLSKTLIVCSDVQPLPEVGGDAALYIDLDAKTGQVAGRIHEHLQSQKSVRLQRRIRQNFTWAGVFEQQMVPLLNEKYPL